MQKWIAFFCEHVIWSNVYSQSFCRYVNDWNGDANCDLDDDDNDDDDDDGDDDSYCKIIYQVHSIHVARSPLLDHLHKTSTWRLWQHGSCNQFGHCPVVRRKVWKSHSSEYNGMRSQPADGLRSKKPGESGGRCSLLDGLHQQKTYILPENSHGWLENHLDLFCWRYPRMVLFSTVMFVFGSVVVIKTSWWFWKKYVDPDPWGNDPIKHVFSKWVETTD